MSTKQNNSLSVVVMGLDADGKPHAAVFPASLVDMAAKAASDWKLRLGRAETDAALLVAKDLPHGRMFPSNKMGPPSVRRETYDLLLKVVKTEGQVPPSAASGKSGPEVPSSAAPANPDPWEAIEVGSIVLWQADPTEGYFPCIVKSISKDRVTLQWRDFKGFPTFQAKRNAVGLLAKAK